VPLPHPPEAPEALRERALAHGTGYDSPSDQPLRFRLGGSRWCGPSSHFVAMHAPGFDEASASSPRAPRSSNYPVSR
jgi:hypothetical protein